MKLLVGRGASHRALSMLCTDSSNKQLCLPLLPNTTSADFSCSSLFLPPLVCAAGFCVQPLHFVEMCVGMRILIEFLNLEISCKFVWELLFNPILLKASDVLTCVFFDFILKFSEMCEHFSLLMHEGRSRCAWRTWHNIGICEMWLSMLVPNIKVDYVQDSFSHIPLYQEWMSALFSKLTFLHHSFSVKFRSLMMTPVDCMFWSLWQILFWHVKWGELCHP